MKKPRYHKSKKVEACYCCGGTNLTQVEIDPETLDETADWKQYTTGYICSECGNINHTDGVERGYTITNLTNPDDVFKLSDNREGWWVKKHDSPTRETQPA